MDKYNSIIPRFFCKPGTERWAVTLFGTTYYTVSKDEVGQGWRRHEDCHKRQQAEEGRLFYIKYLWYMLRYGYWDNPYEVEARKCE